MNKQIEDLGKKLRAYAYDMKLNDNDDCQNVADFIITTLGYRKTEEIAREIFAEIEKIKLKEIHKCETLRERENEELQRKYWEGGYNALRQLSYWLAELKKKYESEGADDDSKL